MVTLTQNYALNKKYALNSEQRLTTSFYGIHVYAHAHAQVRTFNVEKTKNMRMLNPEDIDQLITISGMVIRTSPLIPEMREAFFR